MNEILNAAKLLGSQGGKKTLKNKGKKHFKLMGENSAKARKVIKLANLPVDNSLLTTSGS